MLNARSATDLAAPPFDTGRLDELLAECEVDVLLATSPHNVQYLLGGYRFFFFEHADAIALSRYTPVVVYPRERSEDAVYVGAGNEDWGTDVEPLWVSETHNVAWSAADAARDAAAQIKRFSAGTRVGIEPAFLPLEATRILERELPHAELVDASEALEELRAVKTEPELAAIRDGSRAVVDAMLATFATTRAGETKAQVAERLRQQETQRGLTFDYCLVAAGPSLNRAPSDQVLELGAVLSLDSGAHRNGYVADLARMGIASEPTDAHRELLAQIEHVQSQTRQFVRGGARGGDVFAVAEEALADCPERERMSFLAHGCGLVTHEAPRLTATGSPPYRAAHAERRLLPGMVLSLETHLAHPDIGFIKLEDTVIVEENGAQPVADHGRGWNRLGEKP